MKLVRRSNDSKIVNITNAFWKLYEIINKVCDKAYSKYDCQIDEVSCNEREFKLKTKKGTIKFDPYNYKNHERDINRILKDANSFKLSVGFDGNVHGDLIEFKYNPNKEEFFKGKIVIGESLSEPVFDEFTETIEDFILRKVFKKADNSVEISPWDSVEKIK